MQVDTTGSIASLLQGTKEAKPAQTNPSVEQQTQSQQQPQQTRQTDTVTFTQAATQLAEVEQHIKSASVTDTQRIEQVQAAIKNGSYTPDPVQVAGKMLNFESTLNSTRA